MFCLRELGTVVINPFMFCHKVVYDFPAPTHLKSFGYNLRNSVQSDVVLL